MNMNLSIRGLLSQDSDFMDFVQQSNDCFDIVHEQCSRFNVANKSVIMDLTQRVTVIVSLLAIKSSALETKLIRAERDLLATKLNNINACAPAAPASCRTL
jgi:hypothetical protein